VHDGNTLYGDEIMPCQSENGSLCDSLLDYDGNISEAEIKNGNSQAEVTF
jgi:hypothetical protein